MCGKWGDCIFSVYRETLVNMLRRLVTSKVRQRWAEQQQQQQQQQHCYYRPPLVEEETEAITAGYCSLEKNYMPLIAKISTKNRFRYSYKFPWRNNYLYFDFLC